MEKEPTVRQVILQKRAGRKRWKRLLGRSFLLLLGVSILWWVGSQLVYFGLSRAVRTVQAAPGNLAADFTGRALVLRNETVINTPVAGKPVPLVKEETLVRKGMELARIEPPPDSPSGQPTTVTSPQPGLVSFQLDGWEGILVPEQWPRLNFPSLFVKVAQRRPQTKTQLLTAGAPLLKIIDNLSDPVLVLQVYGDGRYDIARNDQLDLTWQGGRGSATVMAVTHHQDYTQIVTDLDTDADALPPERLFGISLRDQKCRGVILPEGALLKRNGRWGVLIRTPGGIAFKKVALLGRIEHRVAVDGLTPGVEVVTNPTIAEKVENI